MLFFLKILFFFMFFVFLNETLYFYLNKKILFVSLNEMFNYSFLNFIFLLDFFSLCFSSLILLISLIVMNFVYQYLYKSFNMFFFSLMTFVFLFSMLELVFSMNILTMIFGWEGLGFSSFYLIFYFNSVGSWKSSLKTFINNKIGDSFFLMSMLSMILLMDMYLIFFLMVGLFTKTAQYPFMSWLPLAMAAPTPISSMVHSSTLVTAGIYVYFRLSNLFFLNCFFFMDLCLFSMMISGLKSLMEKDLKKLIALSTLSQVGLIMFLNLINLKFFSFFYMCNHALFKSLMFINMGHSMTTVFSNQFSFNMKFNYLNWLNKISFFVSCFNLMNLTFFSSFFLKEILMNINFMILMDLLMFFFFLLVSFFTMNYTLKFMFFIYNNMFSVKLLVFFMFNKFSFSFSFFSVFSLVLIKFFFCSKLIFWNFNLILILIYIFMLMLNFINLEINSLILGLMIFLDFLLYSSLLKKFSLNMDFFEMWMEMLSFFFIFSSLKNSFLKKPFKMNFKMILVLIFMIIFFGFY